MQKQERGRKEIGLNRCHSVRPARNVFHFPKVCPKCQTRVYWFVFHGDEVDIVESCEQNHKRQLLKRLGQRCRVELKNIRARNEEMVVTFKAKNNASVQADHKRLQADRAFRRQYGVSYDEKVSIVAARENDTNGLALVFYSFTFLLSAYIGGMMVWFPFHEINVGYEMMHNRFCGHNVTIIIPCDTSQ